MLCTTLTPKSSFGKTEGEKNLVSVPHRKKKYALHNVQRVMASCPALRKAGIYQVRSQDFEIQLAMESNKKKFSLISYIIWSSFELTEFTRSLQYNHATFSGSQNLSRNKKILPQELENEDCCSPCLTMGKSMMINMRCLTQKKM